MAQATHMLIKRTSRNDSDYDVVSTGSFSHMMTKLEQDGGRFMEVHKIVGDDQIVTSSSKVASNFMDAERSVEW